MLSKVSIKKYNTQTFAYVLQHVFVFFQHDIMPNKNTFSKQAGYNNSCYNYNNA
jgi:hypothetical protein